MYENTPRDQFSDNKFRSVPFRPSNRHMATAADVNLALSYLYIFKVALLVECHVVGVFDAPDGHVLQLRV